MTPDMVVGAPEYARSLLGSLGSGVVGIDETGRIALLNEGARRILGCPTGRPEDALGRDCREVLEAQPTIACLLLETLDGRGPLSRAELTLDRSGPAAAAATVGFTLCPVRDASGRLRGAAMLLRDLTPFERADEQERLRQRLVALGEMAAGLAHEIRNPLAGMEVLAGLLRRRLAVRFPAGTGNDAATAEGQRSKAEERTAAVGRAVADPGDLAQARALVDDLADQIQRLARTVNASLDFVRPVDLARETLDPVQVVEGALQRARPCTSGHEAIERLYVDPLPRLVGDGNLLEVAVANLISNACEAMAGGDGRRVARLVVGLHGRSVERTTGPVRIGRDAPLWRDPLRWRDSGLEEPEVVISVSDTGPGIPPELQERIFYPFFTTKQDGSGVGLSNVQKIVSGHGGAVVVESRPGEGATFRIHLPGTLEST
jgi:signal transduction histidine kinase